MVNITSTSPLTGCFVDLAYGFQFTNEGGVAPFVWTKAGTWPTGLSMSTAGLLDGTPTAVESQSVDVTVTDAGLDFDTETFFISCISPVVKSCCLVARPN